MEYLNEVQRSLKDHFNFNQRCAFHEDITITSRRCDVSPCFKYRARSNTFEGLGVNQPNSFYRLAMHAELGFLAPLEHQIQFSNNGTVVDYVNEGGQDNLFAVNRFSMDWMVKRHVFVLLYQPLELNTAVNARKTYVIENETFPEGDPLLIKYSFPFLEVRTCTISPTTRAWTLRSVARYKSEMLVLSSPQAMVKNQVQPRRRPGSLTQTKGSQDGGEWFLVWHRNGWQLCKHRLPQRRRR